jgi:CRP-like cAMP-binding protein
MTSSSEPKYDRKRFPAGELILHEGDLGQRAYLVETGLVEISRLRGDRRVVLGRVGPGGIFGELALIDGNARVADAKAITETVCLVVPGDVFREKLEKADPFIRAMLRIMARNIRTLTDAATESAR